MLSINTHHLRKLWSALIAVIGTTVSVPAFPDIVFQQANKSTEQSTWRNTEQSNILAHGKTNASPELSRAIQNGLWSRACGLATNILAEHEPNLDALGIFGICQALLARQEETATALKRLSDVEPSPGYYATLTQGVAHLRSRSINEAGVDFRQVLKIRPDDPLAMYFRGELLHAQHKETEAIAAFNSVLKVWPEFAPALSAAARLMVAKSAQKQTLESAISMSERAAHIEPMNLAYWIQTADLYDRAGQHNRAQAIRLQWLTRPTLPVEKK